MVRDYKYRATGINSHTCLKCWSISALLIMIIVIQHYALTPSSQAEKLNIPSNTRELVLPDKKINTQSNEPLLIKDKNSKYSMQVGSFSSLNEAVKHQKQLKAIGFKSIIERLKSGNTTWNRVKLGPYSITEVKRNKQKLQKHGIDVVVTKIQTTQNN